MATYTVKIVEVQEGVDWQGNPSYYVTYKIAEWPELGPWTTVIPKTYMKDQAKAKITSEVVTLATNVYEFYGLQFTVTI